MKVQLLLKMSGTTAFHPWSVAANTNICSVFSTVPLEVMTFFDTGIMIKQGKTHASIPGRWKIIKPTIEFSTYVLYVVLFSNYLLSD